MALVPFPGPQAGALETSPEEDDAPGGKMSFLEHLDEFRKRIVAACIGIAVGVAATFWWIEPIFNFILKPTRAALHMTTPCSIAVRSSRTFPGQS